jgi:type II secretory pathway component GspD/PulD (secretin)
MDIPVLGQLFGTSNKTSTRTALLFLLTADPITPAGAQRTGAGAERVTVPATPATTEGGQRP